MHFCTSACPSPPPFHREWNLTQECLSSIRKHPTPYSSNPGKEALLWLSNSLVNRCVAMVCGCISPSCARAFDGPVTHSGLVFVTLEGGLLGLPVARLNYGASNNRDWQKRQATQTFIQKCFLRIVKQEGLHVNGRVQRYPRFLVSNINWMVCDLQWSLHVETGCVKCWKSWQCC